MFREDSFGIIPLQKRQSNWYVCLIQHKNGNFWAFPKGHPESGEEPKESAIRELAEETGLQVSKFLFDEPISENYHFKREGTLVDKWVHYFIAEVSGDIQIDQNELLDSKWVLLDDAEAHVTYEEAKRVCQSVRHKLL